MRAKITRWAQTWSSILFSRPYDVYCLLHVRGLSLKSWGERTLKNRKRQSLLSRIISRSSSKLSYLLFGFEIAQLLSDAFYSEYQNDTIRSSAPTNPLILRSPLRFVSISAGLWLERLVVRFFADLPSMGSKAPKPPVSDFARGWIKCSRHIVYLITAIPQ
ncbi:hypothetical protein BDB00DRAFT_841198 [Zychaea mexicana]|uniref:uncharacterized protein n=1 Tax=Zychaea mexicana TaxID=64656 RepID=UPI0022FE3713|nr:uncharacterized protein BDB00DRAFT_841198 [Zychaea mexicana]KAI9489745.1 hypothetical protein BDB00DRAFT_841198 [Zychaea mexicana]